jgi:hypothetical protein
MRGCSSTTDFLVMNDPFETYNDEVDNFLAKPGQLLPRRNRVNRVSRALNRGVYLIGVNHKYQIGPDGVIRVDASDDDFAAFAELIRTAVASQGIRGIAEEMSLAALRKHFVHGPSFTCRVAAEIGLPHRYCDPDPETQKSLNITSPRQREAYWVRELMGFNRFPVLFIAGADHIDSFNALLTESGLQALVIARDWAPA